ncbi:MAG TPA: undecaprenyldiphospho-muramoylpentapeptide beta-N-acetylglucosaminyltransferase [Verrucomicrobiae bacterium]|nr:undecaprenyldiphospho-muramoylpentapeptide beta-N-acetylglucosaminyltransferase [Verrucomicrobiae bacterium]
MRVLLTGGGTGGHIYPALAIANEIKQKYPEAKILFVGNSSGMEADVVPREGFDFRSITVEGLPRKLHRVFHVMKVLAKTCKGGIDAYRILRDFKPTVVVGTGGYVCFSVVMLAALLKIPTLIQEQNALPGRTNRILAHVASKVAVTFPESIRYFTPKAHIVVTGLPVRDEVVSADRAGGISAFGLKEGKFTILGVGGSQGARSLNRAMVEVIANTAAYDDFQVIHVTGQAGYDETLKELEVRGIRPAESGNITFEPYLYNIAQALAAADLVVCRAGATTIAEVEVRGLPAILIPYPYAANNHQEYNARALVKGGAAIMIKDRDLTGQRLWEEISSLSRAKTRLAEMAEKSRQMGRPNALKHLVQIIADLST